MYLDYLTIKVTEGGKDVHMLIITDHCMRYAKALVISSQTGKCTAQALWDQSVVHYGLPEGIISMQGKHFELPHFRAMQVGKTMEMHTSLYHPQTNGQCKWFNHTLINTLGTLPPNEKFSRETWC